MATKNALFYSCKFNRKHTIKSHKTKQAAIKAAGDFGMIFDSQNKAQYQIHKMANGSLKAFSHNSSGYSAMNFEMQDTLQELDLI